MARLCGFGQLLVTDTISHAVVVACQVVLGRSHRVARGIIEYDDVAQFYLSQSFHAAIVPMGILQVTLATEDGQRVLGQGHCQRRLRNAGSVTEFRHEEVVAREQGFLEGG